MLSQIILITSGASCSSPTFGLWRTGCDFTTEPAVSAPRRCFFPWSRLELGLGLGQRQPDHSSAAMMTETHDATVTVALSSDVRVTLLQVDYM